MAIDKPAGWMLAPDDWTETGRNLQLALVSSINAGDYWARSRRLKFLRYVHRLDSETSGVLLLAKSLGAVRSYGQLFHDRQVEKGYLAVVQGRPACKEWSCAAGIVRDASRPGRMRIDKGGEGDAETSFRVLQTGNEWALVEAIPVTGRTHQIRLHLAESGFPVVGDKLYGANRCMRKNSTMALRAVSLSFRDPFERKLVRIHAPVDSFIKAYGFEPM
jgi:23S rRNA pseudouridine1911/1915/1917 synthase